MNKLTVVYGGQWGSEGKGDVVVAIAKQSKQIDPLTNTVGIRVGGPNAGHTILDAKGVERKIQSMPVVAYVDQTSIAVLGAGAVVLPDLLARELRWLNETWDGEPPAVMIDNLATTIFPWHMSEETVLKSAIGSTGEGVGAATASKAMRTGKPLREYCQDILSAGALPDGKQKAGFGFESDEQWEERVSDAMLIDAMVVWQDTPMILNQALLPTDRIVNVDQTTHGGLHYIVEGTQGVLLSLNVSGYYPFCTSRDCTPEAILGCIGLTPYAFDEYRSVCVLRTFPIRVGGNSGDLPNEVTWEWMMEHTNGYITAPEKTTVTKKNRRIARWSIEGVQRTLLLTRPTEVAMTFLDYEWPSVAGSTNPNQDFGEDVTAWLIERENELGVSITWIGVGPHQTLPLNTTDLVY